MCVSCGLSLATLPSVCYVCGKGTRANKPCSKHIGRTKPQHVYIHSEYKDFTKELLQAYKFKYKRAAAKDIARLMDATLPYFVDPPLITFVPTIGKNVRERGFDHAKLIAGELAKMRGWHYAPLLRKTKHVRQIGAKRDVRKKQLKDALAAQNVTLIKDAQILLVDDVVTTGATLEVCAATLVDAGASGVSAVVLARTPDK